MNVLSKQNLSSYAPLPPLPLPHQVAWQRGAMAIFVHLTVNTFTDREWGDGTESPGIFNPAHLDANQWATAARDAGASHMVLTAKHHDGFCLWPSRFTDHTVAHSPYKNGHGDIVREFVDACRSHGLKAGLYLSPWDRHEPTYGNSPRYNEFYLNQLTELLTQYGELAEIWFDGACGEGPNGKRQEYDWPTFFSTCAKLQPQAVTFGDGGTTVRWIGNERGIAGDPNWAMTDPALVRFPGDSGIDQANDARAKGLVKTHQLQHGNESGTVWQPGESDVSIRPGWFYHSSQDAAVRSVSNLVDLYFKSTGRNSLLMLNVPPTREGLFHDIDVARLKGLGDFLRNTFGHDLADGAQVTVREKSVELRFAGPTTFDVLLLEEQIELGQRVKSYRVFHQDLAGNWQWLVEAQTIGCRKLDRFDAVTAQAVRLDLLVCRAAPVIRTIGVFKAS